MITNRRLLINKIYCWSKNWFLVLLIFSAFLITLQPSAQAQDLLAANQLNNPIVIENQKAGTTDWELSNPATKREIEGYASLTSVNRGNEIKLFVNTREPNYTIEIFRMGWYGGAGGRQIVSAIPRVGVKQPAPIVDEVTGLIECNWKDPYILKITDNPNDPTQWLSGIYLAKLTASKSGKQSYIIFVVRDDSRYSDILYQLSVTTYQAYNNWGGMSLYRRNSRGKQAYKVSFNRPYAASPKLNAAYGVGAGEFLTNVQIKNNTLSAGWEYNMVRWLERSGYDVSYITDIDTHENPLDRYTTKPILWLHKAFLSVGHDEYWSAKMRQNVETAKDYGVSLGFFSANTCYWQIRFEPSFVTKEINRTMVAYKENAALDPFARDKDPTNDYLITTRWRSKPVNRPEESLIGVMYETYPVNADIVVNETAPDWLLAGTQLDINQHTATVKSDRQTPVEEMRLRGLLGYEADRIFGYGPANTIRVAHSPYAYKGGKRHSDMTIYSTDAKGIVFATGSMQWSWGLDDYNAPQLRPSVLSADAQTITHNILDRMIKGSR
ncbi:N,N-dimethylformamidase beta subunit family domain-containing protein [Calothrix sp. NIES-2098]|uniref:N,N-dimethylformamidase beta subunit family domain-containing protein n=1 Tax=Calothrix sp. NIES-2098 TaxID=1954171 RepID=UPI000B6122A3|nr:Ig domain protein group 1 domain protein [Calothrix sp. NIES-2098]